MTDESSRTQRARTQRARSCIRSFLYDFDAIQDLTPGVFLNSRPDPGGVPACGEGEQCEDGSTQPIDWAKRKKHLQGLGLHTKDQGGEKGGDGEALKGTDSAGASPPPEGDDGKRDKTKHGQQRADEAKKDSHRSVGDSNRVIREGRELIDNDTGNTVHVNGDRVVVTN